MKEVELLAILDCGAQYTKVIDRKVRELGVKSDIFPIHVEIEKLKGYQAIILSGGPSSVWSHEAPRYDEGIFDLNVPILGICYGMQLITNHFGGKVKPSIRTEYGETTIDVDPSCALFQGLLKKQVVLMSHGDSVDILPQGFKTVAVSNGIVAGIADHTRKIYGVQFHPEVDLTENGKKMLSNFLYEICQFEGNYTLEDRVDTAIEKIKQQVGDKKVLALVSGGVDSAVSAALLCRALDPQKVYAVHMDHGLMRKEESARICTNLHKLGLVNLVHEKAQEAFFHRTVTLPDGKVLGPLTSLVEPEEKRALIGQVFIEVLHDVSDRLGLNFEDTYLAQGTLRPDLIESGNPDVSHHAHKIKTHHNDVDIVRKARDLGRVVETNWDWHKDEVRQVARMLGIEESIASRQPFPGPGLGVRVICDKGDAVFDSQEQAILEKLLKKYGEIKGQVVPIRSVGVQGDCRSYRRLAVLWGQECNFDWDRISAIAKDIPNNTDFINRVAYVLNRKEIGTIKVKPLFLNEQTADILREVDALVTQSLERPSVHQVFAVLLPFGKDEKYSVAIRAFVTNDFMTGRPGIIGKEISREEISELVQKIENHCPQIDLILYDVTGKPPATVEWE